MKKFKEIPYPVNQGVNVYPPEMSASDLFFCKLKNLQPRFLRLNAPLGFELFQTLGTERIMAYAYYTHPYNLYSFLYAITETKVYVFDFETGEFNPTAIYEDFTIGNEEYVVVPWYDEVYVTKRGAKMVKLSGGSATEVDDAPSGLYGQSSNAHLLLANISTPTGRYPGRVQWSDLYLPERFLIDTDSQADYYDFEAGYGEITGTSYQRGKDVFYLRKAIWVAQFLSATGEYRFDPLYTGIGNFYHNAVVRVKEVDFFIGKDNFYALDGFQLRTIGDPIWKYFKTNLKPGNLNTKVIGVLDEDNGEVFWKFIRTDDVLWSVVYNYKEDKWSWRDPQDENSRISFEAPPLGVRTIDSFNDPVDDLIDGGVHSAELIDGDWQYLESDLTGLIGGTVGRHYVFPNPPTYYRQGGDQLDLEFETFDFFFGLTSEVKEIDKVTLQYTKEQLVDEELQLFLEIGVRNAQSADITWSSPYSIEQQLDDKVTFHFRNVGVGKFIRFRVRATNTPESSITSFTMLALSVLMTDPDADIEK